MFLLSLLQIKGFFCKLLVHQRISVHNIFLQVSFTGIWSRNTHPRLYPENDWVPKYSNLVGASHSADLILWSPGSLASDGLKELAEHANTSQLEEEIREKVNQSICLLFPVFLLVRRRRPLLLLLHNWIINSEIIILDYLNFG